MLTRSRLASVFARAFAGPAEHTVAAPTTVGVRPRCMRHVAGCDVSPDLAYHTGHVWAREVAPRRFAVGIDDFAARLFGEATRVTPPALGSIVVQGGRAGRVRAGPRAADFVSAVGGEVVAVNPRLAAEPGLVTRDPYGAGWIFVVRIGDSGADPRTQLLSGALAETWTRDACDELELLLDTPDGWACLADGASGVDRAASLESCAWRPLARRFLRI